MVRRTLVLSLALVLVYSLSLTANAQANLRDIENNWARGNIESLVAKGIVSGYPDQTFRPDRHVTRAEFAKMMASAFSFDAIDSTSFKDISNHWARSHILTLSGAGIVEGYPDNTFRPDQPISRAEVVAMIIRTLRMDDIHGYSDGNSFSDVPKGHWAHDAIETALRLKILPPYLRGTFGPTTPATRAETAAMIDETLKLHIVRGAIDYLDESIGTIGVITDAGIRDFTMNADTVIHRNTTVAPFSNLRVGDAVYVVSDRFGSPQFVKANGVITSDDVATKMNDVTRGLLTPSDLQAIIRGDWNALGQSLQSKIYDQLLAQGATPVEAAAIMTQDWESLKSLGKKRLAQAIGEQLGITTDLATALLDRDWDRARELAQTEALEQLLGHFLLQANA